MECIKFALVMPCETKERPMPSSIFDGPFGMRPKPIEVFKFGRSIDTGIFKIRHARPNGCEWQWGHGKWRVQNVAVLR